MNAKYWLAVFSSCSDNLKSKTFGEQRRSIENLKRVGLLAIVFSLAICGAGAQAQSKIPRIGILFIGGRDQPHLEEFKQGLRELGYSEGKNIVLEYRYAEGNYDRLPELAREFVREKVDIIVTTSTYSALAAHKETRTIP